jgi:hypothetical protein
MTLHRFHIALQSHCRTSRTGNRSPGCTYYVLLHSKAQIASGGLPNNRRFHLCPKSSVMPSIVPRLHYTSIYDCGHGALPFMPPDKESATSCSRITPDYDRYLFEPSGREDEEFRHDTKKKSNSGTVLKLNSNLITRSRSLSSKSRERSVRQGGRTGDKYRRYQTCH